MGNITGVWLAFSFYSGIGARVVYKGGGVAIYNGIKPFWMVADIFYKFFPLQYAYLHVCLYTYPSISIFTYLPTYLFIFFYLYISICLSVYVFLFSLFVCPFFYLSTLLFNVVYPYLNMCLTLRWIHSILFKCFATKATGGGGWKSCRLLPVTRTHQQQPRLGWLPRPLRQ